MFACKACLAKDRHITSLEIQNSKLHQTLEKVVAPTYAPALTHQANIALDGAGHEQETDEPQKDLSPVEQQAIAMLTGHY